jgi:hypothetical protein
LAANPRLWLGLNGLYVNQSGRERWGIVPARRSRRIALEIATRLAATIDPATGLPAVSRVHRSDTTYEDRGQLAVGPDLVVGYAEGDAVLGRIGPRLDRARGLRDNVGAWSGDHCMDHTAVPGILFTNRALRRPTGRLQDLGISILAEFGLEAGAPAAASRR